jgi:hypothetical protein
MTTRAMFNTRLKMLATAPGSRLLNFFYNLSAERAMGILSWRAKELSIGVDHLNAKFGREVTSEDVTSDPVRRHVNHVLLRAHEGIAGTAD